MTDPMPHPADHPEDRAVTDSVTGPASRPVARPVAAAVFDCDGLLLDTESLWLKGEAALFATYGREFTREVRRKLLGQSVMTIGPLLEELLERPGEGEELARELLERSWGEIVAGAAPRPGAVELVRRLSGTVPIALASNSPRALVEDALRVTGMTGAFDVVLGADDVGRAKPDPALYLTACERLGAPPASSVALEDSPTGVAAARAAGMYVIGVPSVEDTVLDADLVSESLQTPEVHEVFSLG